MSFFKGMDSNDREMWMGLIAIIFIMFFITSCVWIQKHYDVESQKIEIEKQKLEMK
jgi:uncharacterized membrane protein YdbT with pleckstrin-like domain